MSANPTRLSVLDALSVAFDRMRRILFEPFDAAKWFTLGFCAFLAELGEGGGGGGGRLGSRLGNRLPFPPGGGAANPADWVRAHLPVVLLAGTGIFVVLLAVGLVIAWLSSRGKFMFLDGVVRNRGAVVEPWHRHREVGWSLFVFRVAVGIIAAVLMLGVLALAVVVIWPVMNGGHVERIWMPLAALLGGAFLIALPFMVIHFLINQFFVPIMYVRGGSVGDAWAEFRARLMPELGTVIVFAVMYVLLSIGALLIAMVATCLTCCLAALPYLGTVILLPLSVFFRCWSIELLAQLGGDYTRLRGTVDVGGTFD